MCILEDINGGIILYSKCENCDHIFPMPIKKCPICTSEKIRFFEKEEIKNERINEEIVDFFLYTLNDYIWEDNNLTKFLPIENFKFNILKSRILQIMSYKVEEIYPRLTMPGDYEKFLESPMRKISENVYTIDVKKSHCQHKVAIERGFALYLVCNEQSLVAAVTAAEDYFRYRFIYTIKNDKRLLNKFKNMQITVEKITEIDNLSDIGELIAEKIDFQKLNDVRSEYKKIFGSEFEICNEEDLSELKKIFAIRHIITHKAGIIDQKFVRDSGLNCKIGRRFILGRDETNEIINFIERIITNLENNIQDIITKKPDMVEPNFDAICNAFSSILFKI